MGSHFSVAYDPAAHELVTFGGVDSYDVTWLWDEHRWQLARPPVSPPGRFGAAAAYDPLTRAVMVYGGRLGPGEVANDTWAWDGTTWTKLDGGSGSPPDGQISVMAWDDSVREMVLVSAKPGAGSATWTWNGGRWVRQLGGDLPSGTVLVSLAFDPVTRTLLGAACCAALSGATSTWAWNGSGWRQIRTEAQPAFSVALVGDPAANRALLLGDPSLTPGTEMWAWTGLDWTPVAGAQLPAFPQGAVTDTRAGRVVVLGSVSQPVKGHPQPIHVWSWTGATWDRLG